LQRKHDKVYQWKALRMISRESLPIFARTAFTGDLEEAARGFFPGEVRQQNALESCAPAGMATHQLPTAHQMNRRLGQCELFILACST
jgi:hypothetical protein